MLIFCEVIFTVKVALILPELSGSAIGSPDVNITINMAANGVGTIAITATGMY